MIFYDGLIDLALASKSGQIDKERRDRVIDYVIKLRNYSEVNPVNFLNKQKLMEAELHGVANDIAKAKACYKEAIVHSKANNFIHEEALSMERAALFHLKIEEKDEAIIMLQQSYQLYQRWGAFGKSSQLKSLYPEVKFKNTCSHSNFVFFDLGKSSDSVSEITQSTHQCRSTSNVSNASDSAGQHRNKRVRFSPSA